MLNKLTSRRKNNLPADLPWEKKGNNKHVLFILFLDIVANNDGNKQKKNTGGTGANSK